MKNRYVKSPIIVVATKELKDSLRNRWVLFMGSMFLLLAVSVTFAGSAVIGEIAPPPLANLMSSLSTISVFIIPLAAILLSYDSFVGEHESGTLLLLLSYPISRPQILLGKLLGHCLVMFITTSCAFGLTAILLVLTSDQHAGSEVFSVFAQFILSSNLLALTFVLLGYIVSIRTTEKAKTLAGLLFVWFLFVLIYDLLLLVILVADLPFMGQGILNMLIVLNPTDLYRAINLSVGGIGEARGTLSMLANISWSLPSMYLMMLAWIGGLVLISLQVFKIKPL